MNTYEQQRQISKYKRLIVILSIIAVSLLVITNDKIPYNKLRAFEMFKSSTTNVQEAWPITKIRKKTDSTAIYKSVVIDRHDVRHVIVIELPIGYFNDGDTIFINNGQIQH